MEEKNHSLAEFLSDKNDGVFIIGHSSALARIGGNLIMFDPVWDCEPYGSLWKLIPNQVNCDSILSDAHCFVSHEHADHFRPEILKRSTWPIRVMGGRPSFLEARIRSAVNYVSMPPYRWRTFNKESGLECYFVPHPTNNVDSAVFVRGKDFCVYHGNDCFLTRDILERVRNDVSHVDVAMIPYAYVSWWPFLQVGISDELKEKEIRRMNEKHLAMAQHFIEVFRPSITIPAGASLYYNDGHDHILNKWLMPARDVSGGTEMYAGDYCLKMAPDSWEIYRSVWDADGGVASLLEKELGGRRLPPIDTKVDLSRYDFGWLEKAREQSPDGHDININGLLVSRPSLNPDNSLTNFDFDGEIFHLWASRQATMEDIIGTRRFTFHRQPDIYVPDVWSFMRSL
jgi:hypothetical protein